jgi:hypothetical protein
MHLKEAVDNMIQTIKKILFCAVLSFSIFACQSLIFKQQADEVLNNQESEYLNQPHQFVWLPNDEHGGIMITGYYGTSKMITIPGMIAGKPVTSIGYEALAYKELTGVTIPDSVITIEDVAFYRNKLTSITIPDSVTSIGASAFENNRLISVIIGGSVTYIWGSAFKGNNLTSITIPDSVTVIYKNAFKENNLISISMPDSEILIETGAFAGNPLTSITIGLKTMLSRTNGGPLEDDLRLIEAYRSAGFLPGTYTRPNADTREWTRLAQADEFIAADFRLEDFKWFDHERGVVIIGYVGTSSAVTIPWPPVVSIGSDAFRGKNLTSVSIGNGVTSIGSKAFSDNHLDSISIGDSVTSIGSGAFENNRLTSVVIPNGVTIIDEGTFRNNQLTSVTIPDSVTRIGWGAFENNRLTSVVIPGSVTSIGSKAFSDNQLNSVSIGDSVTRIGWGAFENNHLTSVVIPDSVRDIDANAFHNNPLISITIGKDVDGYANWDMSEKELPGILGNDTSFEQAYRNAGRLAGTYTRPLANSRVWTRKQQ